MMPTPSTAPGGTARRMARMAGVRASVFGSTEALAPKLATPSTASGGRARRTERMAGQSFCFWVNSEWLGSELLFSGSTEALTPNDGDPADCPRRHSAADATDGWVRASVFGVNRSSGPEAGDPVDCLRRQSAADGTDGWSELLFSGINRSSDPDSCERRWRPLAQSATHAKGLIAPRRASPDASSAEAADRLEVHVEVVCGGAEGAGHQCARGHT
jgi:hypothetical protein